MEIKTKMEDGTCILFPEGRIDAMTSPQLEEAVLANAKECEKLIIDMSGVDYISSAGIRVIVLAQKTMGDDNFVIRSVDTNVMQILKLTGFDKMLKFE